MKKILFLVPLVLVLTGCQHALPSSSEILEEQDQMEFELNNDSKYQAYSAEKFSELRGNQAFVLFFHADWCPVCRRWEAKVKESGAQLPPETLILKADYDTENALKKEFMIRMQSVVVFFDATGQVVKKEVSPSMES